MYEIVHTQKRASPTGCLFCGEVILATAYVNAPVLVLEYRLPCGHVYGSPGDNSRLPPDTLAVALLMMED